MLRHVDDPDDDDGVLLSSSTDDATHRDDADATDAAEAHIEMRELRAASAAEQGGEDLEDDGGDAGASKEHEDAGELEHGGHHHHAHGDDLSSEHEHETEHEHEEMGLIASTRRRSGPGTGAAVAAAAPWCTRENLKVNLLLAVLVLGAAATIFVAVDLEVHKPPPTWPFVIASPRDTRQYRYFALPNGLRALLVSDPTTDQAAAAMDVHVGSWAEPAEFPGLAHFLEHMLFMGTAKYPSENDYSSFLSSHGGLDNAYTDNEDTNYFFQVDAPFLEGALDRFAQFFIAPLFDPDATEREMNAVDSEHKKNLQSDEWRLFQMLQELANPTSPFYHFDTGDLATLNKPGIRQALLQFHASYYVANHMTLTVLGQQSLDELQTMVTAMFSAVPYKDVPGAPIVPIPYTPQELAKMVLIEPVAQMQQIILTWPLQSLWAEYRAEPGELLASLLGNEGAGSLLSYLKSQSLAVGVSAGLPIDAQGFAVLQVVVSLPPAFGFEDSRIQAVVSAVYAYINMLQASGVTALHNYWSERVRIAGINFQFPQKSTPSSFCSSTARSMRRVDPSFLLDPPQMFIWDATAASNVLNQLTPQNMLVFFVSNAIPENLLQSVEPIYGTRYSAAAASPTVLQQWASASVPGSVMYLPKPNPFIPSNLNILPQPPAQFVSNSTPFLVLDTTTPSIKLWWLQDIVFQIPRVNVRVNIGSPYAANSARSRVLNALYISAVEDALQETAYAATLAGFSYDLVPGPTTAGWQLSLSGYSDHMMVWTQAVMNGMMHPTLDATRLQGWMQELEQDLNNELEDQPYRIGLQQIRLLRNSTRFSVSELVDAVQGVTFPMFQQFVTQVRSTLRFEALVHGNYDSKDAQTLVESIVNAFNAQPLPHSVVLTPQTGSLPAASWVWQQPVPNQDNLNSATTVSYQIGLRDHCLGAAISTVDPMCIRRSALLDVLVQLMSEPAFNVLRTQQQLGYIVFAFDWTAATSLMLPQLRYDVVRSLHVLVQGAVKDAMNLDVAIQSFIVRYSCRSLCRPSNFDAAQNSFANTLASLPESTWQDIVSSVISAKLADPLSLNELTGNLWAEIDYGTYMFDRAQREVEQIQQLQLSDVEAFYRDYVITLPGPRRLSVEIFGSGTQIVPPTGVSAATVINSIDAFRNDELRSFS